MAAAPMAAGHAPTVAWSVVDLSFKHTVNVQAMRVLSADEIEAAPEVLAGVTAAFPAGSRTVLVGSNGAGKSTLLELLAGKRMPTRGCVLVSGQDPFRCPVSVALLTTEWASRVSSLHSVPVSQLLETAAAASPEAAARVGYLASLLEVDGAWLTPELSDGQRRRVQLVISLAPPQDLLLLDEVGRNSS